MSNPELPILYVEGPNDVTVISALLSRYGVDTEKGNKYLFIKALGSVEILLRQMPNAIKAELTRPSVGFVLDIDVAVTNRWSAVCDRMIQAGLKPGDKCPDF